MLIPVLAESSDRPFRIEPWRAYTMNSATALVVSVSCYATALNLQSRRDTLTNVSFGHAMDHRERPSLNSNGPSFTTPVVEATTTTTTHFDTTVLAVSNTAAGWRGFS
jgi:hypothetical protein